LKKVYCNVCGFPKELCKCEKEEKKTVTKPVNKKKIVKKG